MLDELEICATVKTAGARSAHPTRGAARAADADRSPSAAAEPCGANWPLVAILGPTASGKSDLAVWLAERLNGEIVNCDSIQLYRGLDIGSGKVSGEERKRAPHHLLDVLELAQPSTAGDFRRMALPILASLRERKKLPILAGGASLYLRALLDGLFEGPGRSAALRARLRRIENRRPGSIGRVLRRLDPKAAARIHPNDVQKAIRAAEICLLAGEPASTLHSRGRAPLLGFTIIKIGLNPPREQLRARIDARVERMFAGGLINETRAALRGRNPMLRRPERPLLALGYRQACSVLRGEIDLTTAIREAQSATRRYAKRQMTWFRRESDVTWFEGFGADPGIQRRVLSWLTQYDDFNVSKLA